jgi:hypothetical protein
MWVRVACPSCRQPLRVPARMAGRTAVCPRCQDAVPIPYPETLPAGGPPAEDKPAGVPPRALSLPDVADWPWPSRLGLISAAFGLLSVALLCLPGSSYLAPLLGGAGLLLGLGALALALLGGEPGPGRVLAGAGVARGFGTRAVDFPLVGVAACAVALALTLWPLLAE